MKRFLLKLLVTINIGIFCYEYFDVTFAHGMSYGVKAGLDQAIPLNLILFGTVVAWKVIRRII